MARIPQTFIDNLLERADITDIVGRRLDLKRAGNEFTARCPFHDEKTPSFTVVPSKQFYHCFGCGAHGTAIGFVMEYERLEFPDAIEVLAAEHGMEVPRDGDASADTGASRQPLYDTLADADRYYQHCLRQHTPAIDYLKQRGISGATAKRFGLGYAPGSGQPLGERLHDTTTALEAGLVIERDHGRGVFDRFRNRLMFPIRDRRGRVVAFGGRTLGEDRAKYLNSPETPVFHKSDQLYGLFEARQANRTLDQVLVVEGYMDVVALAEHGFDNAVATLGTATTESHIRQLFHYTEEVVFCFDGDTAGQRAADKALTCCLPALRGTRRARFLFVPAGEDPASLVTSDGGSAAFQRQIESAESASSLLLARLTANVDLDSIEGRTQLLEHARAPINALPNDTFRDELLREIARLSGHSDEALRERYTTEPRSNAKTNSDADRRSNAATSDAQRGAIEKTTVTRALTRLLADPELATSIAEPAALRETETPGVSVLADAVEFFAANPTISLAAWIERHRDQRYFDRLQQLAADTPPGDRSARAQEFAEAVRRLMPQSGNEHALRTRYRELLAQQAEQSLDNEAATELVEISRKLAEQ
ncbi:DNA primase [Salinisphaera sp. USBA-960]|nr:DNA primase [Salifodinibacter halophilus]NNC26422.1 DNA primase [Salifodinibacter halophilus]